RVPDNGLARSCLHENAVHPLSIRIFRLAIARQLHPGVPASPGEGRLGLLPSGPDPLHSSPPCGTRISTPRGDRSPTRPYLEREFDPAKADCECRAPPAPHLARR